jgi:hypothetical protein
MGLKMSLETTKLSSKLTKYIRKNAETFYEKDDDAVFRFTVGYMESLIARLMENNPDAKKYVEELLDSESVSH